MKYITDPSKKNKQEKPKHPPITKSSEENQKDEQNTEAQEDVTNIPTKIVNIQDEDVVINKQDHID